MILLLIRQHSLRFWGRRSKVVLGALGSGCTAPLFLAGVPALCGLTLAAAPAVVVALVVGGMIVGTVVDLVVVIGEGFVLVVWQWRRG